jgi:hypothetical protein
MKKIKELWFIKLPYKVLITSYRAYLIPFIFKSRYKRLKQFKNKHSNKRCFIVASGPSLVLDDVNLLKGEICFGMNSIYKLFDKTNWRPNYYGVVDVNVFERIKDELTNIKLNCAFYPDKYIDWKKEDGFAVPLKQGIGYNAFVRKIVPKRFWTTSISTDISKLVYEGSSVVHFLMQIVFYMGFKEVYLLGTDCNYFGDAKHSSLVNYKGANNLANSPEDIYNGLMDDYQLAFEYANKNGIKIFNASRGGMLEIFPRVQLEQVLMSNK